MGKRRSQGVSSSQSGVNPPLEVTTAASSQPTQSGVTQSGTNDPTWVTTPKAPIPSMSGLPGMIYRKTMNTLSHPSDISEAQAAELMASVKALQVSMTEGLNQLSAYRKAVAAILQARRQQRAQARKTISQASGSPTPKPSTLEEDSRLIEISSPEAGQGVKNE